uniref:EFCAB10 C-terminal EF-hand domain-containing protein n=1 Tax=Mola mola TaxID=94237 RepID=A0A3Q3X7A9_MOLML
MATQREEDAVEYMRRHQVPELLENLSSMLFFCRPENPREFLLQQLEGGGVRGPHLFTSTNLDAVFRILDPSDQKYISFAQYKHALSTLGVRDIDECPEGANDDRISRDTFKAEA